MTATKAADERRLRLLKLLENDEWKTDASKKIRISAHGNEENVTPKKHHIPHLVNPTKDHIVKEPGGAGTDVAVPTTSDIIKEQLVRNYQYFGDEAMTSIQTARVVIVGLGGVGSHCAASLARSGVGYLRLIDFDRITLSSLNRHAVAVRADVGKSKVACMKKFIHSVFPDTQVDAIEDVFKASSAETLLLPLDQSPPSLVVDCIDNLPTKVDIVRFCKERDLPIITACGAGAKADPTKLRLTDLSETVEDELARALRLRLKPAGIESGLLVCSSVEKSERKLEPLKTFQESDPDEYRPLTNFRVRTLPVVAPVPAAMGQTLASAVLRILAGESLNLSTSNAEAAADLRLTTKNFKMLFEATKQFVQRTEGCKKGEDVRNLQLSFESTRRLYSGLYHGKSVLDKRSTPSSVKQLQLVPWMFEKSNIQSYVRDDNLILLKYSEAQQHLQQGGTSEKNFFLWGNEACDRVKKLLSTIHPLPY